MNSTGCDQRRDIDIDAIDHLRRMRHECLAQ